MRNGDIRDLEWLLDYELKQSARHRRFVSLVMLTANGNSHKLDKMLNDVVRETDPIFSLPGSMAVLMGETDNNGAQQAIERYREAIDETMDVKFAVASFPDDGKASSELMDTAHRRLEIANTSDSGPVVADG